MVGFSASPPTKFRRAAKSISLTVNNTTGSITMFTITGSVLVHRIWGIVTTVLSSNVTAAFVELNDQSASPDITLASGVTLSSAPVGSLLIRTDAVDTALVLKSSAAGAFQDANDDGLLVQTPFALVKKPGASTVIQFTYTTTNAPSTGAIAWYADYEPLSADGALT